MSATARPPMQNFTRGCDWLGARQSGGDESEIDCEYACHCVSAGVRLRLSVGLRVSDSERKGEAETEVKAETEG